MKRKLNLVIAKIFVLVIKPFSQHLRKVFELAKIRQVLGLLIMISVLLMAILPATLSTVQSAIDTKYFQPKGNPIELKTESSIRVPVEGFTLTQGYHLFHPGIDLAAVKGSPVYPIMKGIVEEIGRSQFAYGNHVVINHGSGLKSFYAHLSKIEVREGEELNKDSILGLVGSTGWSTGPHLHFQVWQDGRWINPKGFFEGYFGRRLASTE